MAVTESFVARHRARKSRAGFVRLEVSVRGEDAPLVRAVAAALDDPARRDAARAVLAHPLIAPVRPSLKALLASAPLEGLDLERSSDTGREVAL